MAIDNRALPIAEAEVTIQADLARVWHIHADIGRWHEWNPKVQSAHLKGPLAVGSVLEWRSGGASIVSTLRSVRPMRTIAWSGKALGAQAHHIWTFERRGKATLVITQESLDGWWPRLLPRLTRTMLHSTLRSWLQHLKQRAEDPQQSVQATE